VLSLDLRSLALARISLGLILALDCLIRVYDVTAHYSDQGVLSRHDLLEYGWHPHFFSLHMFSGQPGFMKLLFAVQLVTALALAVGYRTRWATLLSWVLLVSVHNRNPWLLNGGDVYFRMVLFWMLFLPWGQVWSVDARQKRHDRRWWMPQLDGDKTVRASFACLALLLQVCLLYWFAALPKTHASWVADYSAINIALHLDHLVKPFGLFFRDTFQGILPTLTWGVLYFEVWGPFLLWFPFDRGQLRTLTLFAFIGMHLGFELTMELGLFPIICMAVPLALLPAWLWDGPLKKLTQALDHRMKPLAYQEPQERPKLQYLRESVFGFMVLYLLSWNFGNEQFRPALWLPDSLDWIGYTIRLDQRWNMFSPSPPYQDGWWVITGKKRSGETVNLAEPGSRVSWEKPSRISKYATQRRRRWMMELRATGNEILARGFCRHLAHQFNGDQRSLHEIVEVDLYFMLEITRPDGTEEEPIKIHHFHYNVFNDVPHNPEPDVRNQR
jgi:HTTM domain